jgi:hypothetical protein
MGTTGGSRGTEHYKIIDVASSKVAEISKQK